MAGCLIVVQVLTEFLPKIKVMTSKTEEVDQDG
jgi:hypothetical protein